MSNRTKWSTTISPYRIIGCAIKVHRTLGSGFQEVIYQRALAIEMARAGIDFGREVEQPIYYEGVEIGSRRADFIVGNRCRGGAESPGRIGSRPPGAGQKLRGRLRFQLGPPVELRRTQPGIPPHFRVTDAVPVFVRSRIFKISGIYQDWEFSIAERAPIPEIVRIRYFPDSGTIQDWNSVAQRVPNPENRQ